MRAGLTLARGRGRGATAGAPTAGGDKVLPAADVNLHLTGVAVALSGVGGGPDTGPSRGPFNLSRLRILFFYMGITVTAVPFCDIFRLDRFSIKKLVRARGA